MADNETLTRISTMESNLDSTVAVVEQLTKALDAFEAHRESIKELCQYYGSAKWFDDVEKSNAGEISIKCGVLSEDAAYDTIGDLHQLAIRMLEAGTATIKDI